MKWINLDKQPPESPYETESKEYQLRIHGDQKEVGRFYKTFGQEFLKTHTGRIIRPDWYFSVEWLDEHAEDPELDQSLTRLSDLIRLSMRLINEKKEDYLQSDVDRVEKAQAFLKSHVDSKQQWLKRSKPTNQ